MKYCKDCKYLRDNILFYISPICYRPIKDYVYELLPLRKEAKLEREKGQCGKEAKFFEQKEKVVEVIKYMEPPKKWWQRIFG